MIVVLGAALQLLVMRKLLRRSPVECLVFLAFYLLGSALILGWEIGGLL